MAQTSTVYSFDLSVADVDRGVYESVALKVACHPSETPEYMVTRVLAYGLELQEGLAFSQGLCVADEPALWVRDLTGGLTAWIEVGTPDAPRLHKASKACARVVVYCHKDTPHYLRSLGGQRVFAPDRIEIVEVDRRLVSALAERVERRTRMALSVTEGQLYVDIGDTSLSGGLIRHAMPA